MENFINDGLSINWNQMYHHIDINDKVQFFNENVLQLLNTHAPTKTKIIKEKIYCPWITENIKTLIRLRDRAHKKYLKSKSRPHLEYYKQLRNYTKHAIIREKITFFNQLSNKKGQEFWRVADRLYLTKEKNCQNDLPTNISNPTDIGNFFNSVSNLPDTASKECIEFYQNNTINNVKLNFQLLDQDNIIKIISTIKSNATGIDGISMKDIRLCLPFCLDPLLHIVNECILQEKFPSLWKKAIIKPIPKNSNPKEYKDLRPISILSAASKILEKHIFNQISNFVDVHGVIPDCQSGFRKNFSTSTSLVGILNDIRVNEENDRATCVALLDFSRAFDTINHSMLLAKLNYIGVSESGVNFFRDYLRSREACVMVVRQSVKHYSEFTPFDQGVPQGSIVSPLLFSIYVADMYKVIKHATLQQYADDSQVYIPLHINNINLFHQHFNSDLTSLYKYAEHHNLKLNATKSKILIMCSNLNLRRGLERDLSLNPVSINNASIPVVSEARNLGVIFDSSLSFEPHIKNKTKIAYLRLKRLFKFKRNLSAKQKYLLCDSLILSLFDYGDVVYGNSLSLQNKKIIQKVQNSCMRFSYNIPYRNHISPYLSDNKILNMNNRRKLHMYNFIYRIVNNNQPFNLRSQFQEFGHEHATRNNNDFIVPLHRRATFQRSFKYVAVQMWNGLNNDVKQMPLGAFSGQIKSKLLMEQGIGN